MLSIFRISVIAAIFLFNMAAAQDNDTGTMLLGKINQEQWKAHETWDDGGYVPEDSVVANLKKVLKDDIDIYLFAGSWCSDSEKNVPQIFKLFDEIGITDRIKFYAVNRDKMEPEGKAIIMGLQKVPTIIVLRDGKEIGRITEYPLTSWEKDLFEIIKK